MSKSVNPNKSLLSVQDELGSDEHYASTPTRNYGDLDPVIDAYRFVNKCGCGSASAVLRFGVPTRDQLPGIQNGTHDAYVAEPRHYVMCVCGCRGRAARAQWQAVLEWNKSPQCTPRPNLQSFPFFNLAGLSEDDAKARLVAIRHDLELRKAEAKRKRQARMPVGKGYLERIEAYLGWAIYALSVLKTAKAIKRAGV